MSTEERWTQVYEATNNTAEDGIWKAIHERIGWGYSGVSGAREAEANADVRRAIAAIRADERATEAARYRTLAMVERVAEAFWRGDTYSAGAMPETWLREHYIELARAALAVITEPDDGDSTVQG